MLIVFRAIFLAVLCARASAKLSYANATYTRDWVLGRAKYCNRTNGTYTCEGGGCPYPDECNDAPPMSCPNGLWYLDRSIPDDSGEYNPTFPYVTTSEVCDATSGWGVVPPKNIYYGVTNWTRICQTCPPGTRQAATGCLSNLGDYLAIDHLFDCVYCSDPQETLSQASDGSLYCSAPSTPSPPSAGSCKMNSDGVDMLKKHEVLCTSVYDSSGHKTVGYGHDCCAKGDCATIAPKGKLPNGEADADKLLAKDLPDYERYVANYPGASLMNVNQFSAFVDYAFNAGNGGFNSMFASQIAAKNWTDICHVLSNLAKTDKSHACRRQAEADLCSKPTDTKSGCSEPRRPNKPSKTPKKQPADGAGSAPVCGAISDYCPPWKGGKENCLGKNCAQKCQHYTG